MIDDLLCTNIRAMLAYVPFTLSAIQYNKITMFRYKIMFRYKLDNNNSLRIKRDKNNEYGNNKLDDVVIKISEKIISKMYEIV